MALREVLAKFGFDVDNAKIDAAKSKTDELAGTIKGLAQIWASGVIAGKAKEFVDEIRTMGDDLAKNALRLGISTHALQQWQTAASLAGLRTGEVEAAMAEMQKQAATVTGTLTGVADQIGAIDGTSSKNAADAFRLLGIEVKGVSGQIKPATELMRETGLALAKVEDPAKRTQLALQIFGGSGQRMATLFSAGAEGLEDALASLDKFGGGLSDEVLPLAESYNDRLTEMGTATLSLKSTLMVNLFPILIEITKKLAAFVAGFNALTKQTEIVRASMFILAGALLYTQRAAIASAVKTALAWAPMILLFAALALLLDDVWTAFKGGDSVIAKLFDKLLGKGEGANFFKWAGEGASDLNKRMEKLPGIGDKIEEVFSSLGFELVKFFVDDIPEAWGIFWKNLNQEAGHKGTTFTSFLKEMFGNLLSWFKDWVEDLVDEIIEGMVQGLKDGWVKVVDTFTELGDDLIDTFKDTFKIKSPSEVIYELAGMIPKAVVNALVDWSPKVKDQAEGTFLPITASLSASPSLPGPSTTQNQSSATYRVEMRNTINQTFNGIDSNLRDSVRSGMGDAFDDERQAMLAALEAGS